MSAARMSRRSREQRAAESTDVPVCGCPLRTAITRQASPVASARPVATWACSGGGRRAARDRGDHGSKPAGRAGAPAVPTSAATDPPANAVAPEAVRARKAWRRSTIQLPRAPARAPVATRAARGAALVRRTSHAASIRRAPARAYSTAVSDLALQLTAACRAERRCRTAGFSSRHPGLRACRPHGRPAYIVDEPELRARAARLRCGVRTPPRQGERLLREQGVPCTAVFPCAARGGHGRRRRLGRRAVPRAEGRRRPVGDRRARQRQVARRSGRRGRTGVAFVVVDNPDEITRLADAAASEGVVQDVLGA